MRHGIWIPLLLSLNAGCIATLPSPAFEPDSAVFASSESNHNEAVSCGGELNRLRNNASYLSWGRVGVTAAAGTTAAVSSFVAATKDKDSDGKAEAYIALTSGVVAVLAQLIPDPSSSLEEHRKASSSWNEARRRAAAGTNDKGVFNLLNDCRYHKSYEPPSTEGKEL